MELKDLRKELDTIDNEMAALYLKRMGVCGRVAENKAERAGRAAAEEYGLEILKEGVNQEEKNETRFVVIGSRRIYMKDARKISLCLEIPHRPGALYQIISHFTYNSLNLTNIESRPIPDRNWEFRFFIDFEGSLSDPAVRTVLTGLREEVRGMKILGCY